MTGGPREQLEAERRLVAAGILLDRLLHDLKQPLNLIRVLAQEVRLDVRRQRPEHGQVVSPPDPESLAERMREIERSVDQAARGLDWLRRLARPQRTAIRRAQVAAACRTALQRIREAHPAGRFQTEVPDDLPLVQMGERELEQVLFELLDNGLQAAAEAGRQPELSLRAERAGSEVSLDCHDNGPGLPPAVPARLGRQESALWQGEPGIGLALVTGLLGHSGGRIEVVESGPQGSRLRLHLPALERST